MSDPSPDTPDAYAPRCGHHGNPLVWLDPALRWRCPHCFPELFPAARPAAGSSSPDVTALADELRDWPYGRPAFVRSEAEQAADALEAQATRITELERWKAEALVVLGQWDEVWEALGRPGPLGSSKAVEALTEAHRLRATDPPADVHPRHPRQETT